MKRRKQAAGFTLLELLIVIVMITLITLLALPSMKTFSARNADTNVTTAMANMINKVRDQSRRRNRAYSLEIDLFNGTTPQGRMVIREGDSDSCHRTFADLGGNSRPIERIPFGQTAEEDWIGQQIFIVGLTGWVAPGGNLRQPNRNKLTLCATPDGAMHRVSNRVPQAITGKLRVGVQRYLETFDGWKIEGPPRSVELTFAGGARLWVD